MAKAKIAAIVGEASIRKEMRGEGDRDSTALATRYLLQLLAEKAPGHSVEVRVPPFGAVQVVGGPGHTRGTPPNVIEMDAATWIALATGTLEWAAAIAEARVVASGTRADLSEFLPISWENPALPA